MPGVARRCRWPALTAGLAVLGLAAGAWAQGQDADWLIRRAVFADGRLWLVSAPGRLSSVKPGDPQRRWSDLGEPVVDACVTNGALAVVTRHGAPATAWALHRFDGRTWTTGRRIEAHDESFVAMTCGGSRITLVTSRNLIDADARGVRMRPLSAKLEGALVATVAFDDGDHVYLGFDGGEWGGGLTRIDRATGQTASIEKNASGDLCGGPLNASCDPVNGIVADPWKPGCVIAAVGLIHFSSHGRLVRVCGTEVERLYFKGLGDPGKTPPRADGEPFNTVAFFGLARGDRDVWAVGIDGLYHLTSEGEPTVEPLPDFVDAGGVKVSFAFPGVALLVTTSNEHASISGATPMIVPR